MARERITEGHMVADTDSLARRVSALEQVELDALREALGIPGKAKVYLCVCRLIEVKGVDLLLSAWQQFSEGDKAADSFLLVVGDGPLRADLETMCRTENIRGVIFTGGIDYDEIHRYFALSDVFVIPTLEDNWSLVVPEAMACGLPILCSRYNGCWPELVHHGINGFVFDPRQIERIKEALGAVRENDNLVAMGKKSAELVMNYTPATAAQAIYAACNIALSS
jgi:glycosyltransferase involved in cell wall biosynthesis